MATACRRATSGLRSVEQHQCHHVLLAPSTPGSIHVPASSGGPIAISWSASATATSYRLEQSVNSGAWSQVYAGGGTSKTMTAPATGSYRYRVRGLQRDGLQRLPNQCRGGGHRGCAHCDPRAVLRGKLWHSRGSPACVGHRSRREWYFLGGVQVHAGRCAALDHRFGKHAIRCRQGALHVDGCGRSQWHSDALGSVTNGATSAVAISGSPSSQYTTGILGGRSPIRAHGYHLKVEFFNAGGALISTSSCTMTAGGVGTN